MRLLVSLMGSLFAASKKEVAEEGAGSRFNISLAVGLSIADAFLAVVSADIFAGEGVLSVAGAELRSRFSDSSPKANNSASSNGCGIPSNNGDENDGSFADDGEETNKSEAVAVSNTFTGGVDAISVCQAMVGSPICRP